MHEETWTRAFLINLTIFLCLFFYKITQILQNKGPKIGIGENFMQNTLPGRHSGASAPSLAKCNIMCLKMGAFFVKKCEKIRTIGFSAVSRRSEARFELPASKLDAYFSFFGTLILHFLRNFVNKNT